MKYLSLRQKLIIKYVLIFIAVGLVVGALNSLSVLWKSVYIDDNQTIEDYNSIQYDLYSVIERSLKKLYPRTGNNLEKIKLYISEKNQNQLLSNLPYSRKEWVKGFLLDDNKLKKIKVRHRGDNPNNWLHPKKSWRVKVKRKHIKNGVRVFNYVIPRDTTLINTYLGYFIANMMNIPAPSVRFVELHINDVLEGLYLEIEAIDESFLRKNGVMPVNIYKGTPSRTDKPHLIDADLFNNPYLWQKTSIFNARKRENIDDLVKFLKLIRLSKTDINMHEKLRSMADVKMWARFSAYETLMQTWHNYEKNNMHMISDPWLDKIYPIALDSIFNDTKGRMVVNESVKIENAAHTLMETYMNDPLFIYEKYKIITEMLDNEFYKTISDEARRVYNKIKETWSYDSSHSQFVFTNKYDSSLLTTSGMDEENKKLIDRIDYISKSLKKDFSDTRFSYYLNKNNINLNVYSRLPVVSMKLCGSKLKYVDYNKIKITPTKYIDGCSYFDTILTSNRVRPIKNTSRATTFIASEGFDIQNTIFNFKLPGNAAIKKVEIKILGKEDFSQIDENSNVNGSSPYTINAPFEANKTEKTELWKKLVIVEGTRIVANPVVIEAGTIIKLKHNASLIFENKVTINGRPNKKVKFVRHGAKPWGVIALVGEKTSDSLLGYMEMSGGTGGVYDGKYYTGMFSLYQSHNTKIIGSVISANTEYDDLIHVLYSKNVLLDKCEINDANSDAIDIDISTALIKSTKFINSGNDSIDSMTSHVEIVDTDINKSGDKGVSAGEKSVVKIINTKFNNTEIAIQSKDASIVNVEGAKFINNKTQLNAYRKNWRYNSGGNININGSYFIGDNNLITAQNKSRIIVEDSVFNKEYMDMKTKKIIFKNNKIH